MCCLRRRRGRSVLPSSPNHLLDDVVEVVLAWPNGVSLPSKSCLILAEKCFATQVKVVSTSSRNVSLPKLMLLHLELELDFLPTLILSHLRPMIFEP